MESMSESPLEALLRLWEPVLESSLDAVAAVDCSGQVVYCNIAMRTLLKLRPRQLKQGASVFEALKFPAQKVHPVQVVLDGGGPVRLDEAPAEIGDQKFRVSLKAVAARMPRRGSGGGEEVAPLLGVLLQLRDTSGEILVQAKYHKVMEKLEEKDDQIARLDKKVRELREKIARGYVGR